MEYDQLKLVSISFLANFTLQKLHLYFLSNEIWQFNNTIYFYVILETKKESSNCFLSFMDSVKNRDVGFSFWNLFGKQCWALLFLNWQEEKPLKKNLSVEHGIEISSVVKLSNFIRHEI